MASIMTNTSAMTALQTLRRVTDDLATTQDRISTGLKVNNAKDNAAYWSIATTMRADVAGFKAVKESLELGSGTTNTASVASKNIVENLQTLKARVIAGQTNGVDKSLIQNDIDQLVKLVKGAAADASFNGDNLLRITYSNDGTAKDQNVDILASLSRSAGTVDPSYISFQRQDMQVTSIVGKATIEQQVDSTNDLKASVGIAIGAPDTTFIDGQNLGLGNLTLNVTNEAGTKTAVTVDLSGIDYTTDLATTQGLIETAVNTALTAAGGDFQVAFNGDKLEFTDQDLNTDGNFTAKVDSLWVGSKESDAFGGLADLTQIDVTSNATKSLEVINGLLDKAIGKAAVIGSIENRVSVQNDFVSKLTDSMNKGIGSLVDADMNEESSRLQALQVQQQLATQALSIANQGPQNILSLFR
ncbi:flagellin (plasmid) [Azospirillum baldaniorum]|uniref:Flagellin n=3 Tax=Azospirillum TaxID=191 RepID=A0A5B0KXM1_9PROT|nr:MULTISPECIES: flagellin [Azospirillum]AIB16198.1 flagellin [Azospirillum argentinense]AWJ94723.1 flagellin [Azospirillum baldaniorum]EZQ02650.1 flagellin [Azospirillum argentinense]KAA1056829.1 Flagellin protein FlaA [Azospirillum argentinense]MBK3735098.1 flagellin [Azospirillum brasilense]